MQIDNGVIKTSYIVTIYILLIIFIIFIIASLITIKSEYIPSTTNKVIVEMYDPTITPLTTEFRILSNNIIQKKDMLANINNQIIQIQSLINSIELGIQQAREQYVVIENSILDQIKLYFNDMLNIPYDTQSISNIKYNYIKINNYIIENESKLNDVYITLINYTNDILTNVEIIRQKYLLIDNLNLYKNNATFGVYCLLEIDSLENSLSSRNSPSLLISLCQSNDIIGLNQTYVILPVVTNIIGINIYIQTITSISGDIQNVPIVLP